MKEKPSAKIALLRGQVAIVAVCVDNCDIAHKFFDDVDVAREWCEARAQMAEAEMRVR